jgi:hypothetical protein
MIGRVRNCYERGHDPPPSSGDIQIVSVRPDSLATFLAILLECRIKLYASSRAVSMSLSSVGERMIGDAVGSPVVGSKKGA